MPDSFETEHTNTPAEGDKPTSMSFKVGEREYDADAAAKKISAADEHIRKIEEENAKLRSQAEAAAKLEEALAKLEDMQNRNRNSDDQNQDQPVDVASIVEEKLAAMLNERETAQQTERRKQLAEQTFAETTKQLQEKFGDKVDEEVRAKAEELGISFDKALRMAADPEESRILLKLLGTTPAKGSAMPSSSVSAPAAPESATREQELVQQLRGSKRSRDRTKAFRDLAEHYSSPEAMQKLRDKWDDLHH